MTTQALIYTSALRYSSTAREYLTNHIRLLKSRLPRACMIKSVSLLLVGLGIPTLMGMAILPASLFLGFIGVISFCVGLVTTFYYL